MAQYLWRMPDGTVASSETAPSPGAVNLGLAPQAPPQGTRAKQWIGQATPQNEQERAAQQDAVRRADQLDQSLTQRGIPLSQPSGPATGGNVRPAPSQPDAPTAPPPPPQTRSTSVSAGVTKGEREDYYAMVVQVMASMGISEATAERLGFLSNATVDGLALAKMDANGLRDRFANDDQVIQINPGAPFGMSKQQYDQSVQGLQAAEQSTFGKQVSDFSRLPKERSAREGTTAGLALRERMDPAEYASQIERFRQERGRAPSQQEFQERRARPQTPASPAPAFEAPKEPDAVLPQAGRQTTVRPAVTRRK